ncbi:MAG TPA: DNA adenine methylase [Geothermobacteraceae bacterium]|nr:DNA adenine methylase [Geothermobacteraceae bacterium]
MDYTTPLRYPGGKSKLARFIQLVFEENELLDGHYVEPYAGGAGIAFALLFYEYAAHVHINDLNRSVYAFWHSVLNETDNLCQLIVDTPVSMDQWFRQKSIQNTPCEHSLLDLGFSTFFLNRTNRSGIIGGGVIGGKDQLGKWKIDARYNKESLISRIQKIALFRNRISLYNLDAANLITSVIPQLPPKTLVYLDPPYYVKGHGLYESHYLHEDHAEIAKLITTEIPQKWIVSYDNVPQISGLYHAHRQITYSLSYSAADRYKGSELMVFCDELSIPDVDSPAKIKAA